MTQDVPTSRGFFGYGGDILAGVVSAVLLGFAVTHPGSLWVLLSYTAAIPLFIVGFGAGTKSALIAATSATLALQATAPSGIAIFYLVLYGVPALMLVYLSLRRRLTAEGNAEWVSSEGGLLTVLMLYPCAIFLVIYALTAGHEGGLFVQTLHFLNGATEQVNSMLSDSGQAVTPEMTLKIHHSIEFLAHITPAVAMSTWLLVTILALAAAQALLPLLGLGVRPAFTLEKLRMPRGVVLALLATSLIGFVAPAPYDYIPLNLAILLSVPFFFTGVAVVHAWAAQTKHPMLVLIGFYILIAYLLPLAAVVGVVDQWANFRGKFGGRQLTN